MYQAKILVGQGMKKQQIADILEVDRRTVYNYLNDKVYGKNTVSAGRPAGSKKLASFHGFINQKLEEDLYVSGELLFNKIVSLGYSGKISILYDFLKERRDQLLAYAVMRFETVPGQQAQVDWAECGHVVENGVERKRYCFVMKLGYSRRSYMEFTTSMTQPILFVCMKRAFAYFGGVPLEILFDNMKTAFIFDYDKGQWAAHPKMLAFAAHYGFAPRRCRVRRPQTKGKVEREIRYLRSSFFPSLKLDNMDVKTINNNKLNDMVSTWLKRVDQKILRELGQSRFERFKEDFVHFKDLPFDAYDHRTSEPLKVSMEAKIAFQTNHYSVDAAYRGKMLDGKFDPDTNVMTLYFEGKEVKTLNLCPAGAGNKIVEPADKESLYKAWYEDRERYEKQMRRTIDEKKSKTIVENRIVHPDIYDKIFGIESRQVQGVKL
jgi:transposase